MLNSIWVFVGEGGHFPAGVFSDKDKAFSWAAKNRLTGVLTGYPLDVGVYEWAIEQGLFSPKEAKHETPEFVQRFTCASLAHFHIENGMVVS